MTYQENSTRFIWHRFPFTTWEASPFTNLSVIWIGDVGDCTALYHPRSLDPSSSSLNTASRKASTERVSRCWNIRIMPHSTDISLNRAETEISAVNRRGCSSRGSATISGRQLTSVSDCTHTPTDLRIQAEISRESGLAYVSIAAQKFSSRQPFSMNRRMCRCHQKSRW